MNLRHLPVGLALTLAPALAQDFPFQVPGGGERADAMWADAAAMAKTHLPGKADLGAGWRLPWELAGVVPGMSISERRYWSALEPDDDDRPDWQYFYGLTEVETRGMLDESIGEFGHQFAEMVAGEDLSGHPMAELASPAGMMKIFIWKSRMKNRLVYESHPIFAARLQESSLPITLEYIRARTGQMDPEQTAGIEMRSMRHYIGLFCGDLQGADLAAHIAAYSREASIVRRFTQMTYVHVPDQELKVLEDGQLPRYGTFEVQLHVVAKDAIGREVKDNSAEQMQALQGELTKLLNKLVDELAPGAGRYSVECLGREYGDNSWVIAIDGPSMGGKDLKGFYGRVRTGNAIVDIKGTGTYSRDWMLEQLDYVMGVVEDSTAMFGEDEWR